MGDIITFASSKGGPGKTTAVGCLAAYWCREGRSVALIDSDSTEALTRWHQKAKANQTELGRATLVQCTDDEEILDRIREASGDHDVVLVDCAGHSSRSLVYAAGAAHVVVIPAQPGEGDLVEAMKTRTIVDQARALTQREIACKIFLNRISSRTHVGRHALEQAAAHGLPLFKTTWSDRVGFREGQYTGGAPVLDEPNGVAAQEVTALAGEIEAEVKALTKGTQARKVANG